MISVNHGMGMPSISILLHEITKMLFHAEASAVTYIRVGTSGGIGMEPGTVVVGTEALSETLEPVYRRLVIGKAVEESTKLDPDLAEFAYRCAQQEPKVPCVLGKTLGTNDFYEGQGRMDGAICSYSEEERREWLLKVKEAGCCNIEMEAPLFAAFCRRLSIPGLLVCGVLLDRLKGDQVTSTHEELQQISSNAQEVAIRVMLKRLKAIKAI